MSVATARRSARRIFRSFAVVSLLSLAATSPSSAASLGLRTPFGSAPAHGLAVAPGIRAQAPTAAERAAVLAQLTGGLQPSEVTTQSACQPAPAGAATCAAETLAAKATGARIHPHVAGARTFTQVFPSVRHGIAPAAGSGSQPAPSAGTPGWIEQAYDLTYLSQTSGGGDTVAIVDAYDDPTAETDLGVYRARFGLPACTTANGCFTKVNENGQSAPLPSHDSGWEGEIALDLDAVSAVCPNCRILLVEAASAYTNDLSAAEHTAGTWPGVKQVSNSWGGAWSSPMTASSFSFPGVAVLAAAGDWGTATGGNQFYPAGLPGVNAIGGTAVTSSSGTPIARGFSEAAWSLSNGWGTGSGCNTQAGISKPSYQHDGGCTGRSYSDVSADADPNTGMLVYDNGGWGVWGGTSLASPLTAAYLAVTGIDGTSPGWAYANSALLNDPASGSNGSCSVFYICNAGVGYDGPTGIGSISGALATGGPGIGGPPVGQGGYNSSNGYLQSVNANAATLTGGVYPNGLATTYYWQYGTTTSYGQQSTAAGAGSGQAPVLISTTIQSLAPSTTYHYRLVAQNGAGTSYGYDYTFTTAQAGAAPPQNTAPPTVSGTAQQGQTLSATSGSWNPGASSYAYQWQRSSNGSWSNISGATAAAYVPGVADLGVTLRVTVTASNSYGSASANSAAVGPVASGAPVNTAPPTISGQPTEGQALTVGSSWTPAGTTVTYQWQRSADATTWSNISGATATGYTLQAADENVSIRVIVTASNAYGQASATSPAVGPVHSDPPVALAGPTISGTSQRSYMLSSNAGIWTGSNIVYAYQWQRSSDGTSWTNVSGASATNYTLGPADEATYVRLQLTASDPGGHATATSNATLLVAPFPPANTVAPSISGIAQRTYTLTATPGTWTGAGNSYSYQWQRECSEGFVSIPNATSASYVLSAVDEGCTVRIVVTGSNPDATISEASQPTATVLSALPVNQTAPTISGAAQRGYVISGGQGTWTGIGNSYSYQWQRSADGVTWTSIAGASATSYMLQVADEGSRVRLLVSAQNTDGQASAASQPTAAVQGAAPANTGSPQISGTAQRGSALTGASGSFSGIANTYAYRWQRSADGSSWTDIAGATGPTYTLTVADEGNVVHLLVTAANPDGQLSTASASSATVQAAPAVSTSAPTIQGTAQRGSTLSATQGGWGGVSNSYALQWQRSSDGISWSSIPGASASTYTLQVADEGSRVRMLVTASNPDGAVAAASTASGPVQASQPVSTGTPLVTGTAQNGFTLTGTQGTWNGTGNTYTYQWQRTSDGTNWGDIAGATDTAYALALADGGTKVRLRVTASNPDGQASAQSQPVQIAAPLPPVNTAAPAISGTPVRSAMLSASQGTWSGQPTAFAYQWQRFTGGSSWSDIPGASAASYTLATGDEGTQLRVAVSATNPDGTTTARSSATAFVQASAPASTAAPVLSGVAQRSFTLIATQGSWSGLGNAYAYQWQRSTDGTTWGDVPGATSSTYALDVPDENARLRIVVTATNPDGSAVARSAASAVVQSAAPVNTSVPAISGTAQRASTLTVSQGAWTGIGNTYSYQWQQSSDGVHYADVSGATSATYALGASDENTTLRTRVTATNPDATVTVTTTPTTVIQSAPPMSTSAPQISGTAQRTYLLTAAQGTWSGIGNTYAYRWQRSTNGVTWTDLAGATASTYMLGVADENTTLRVVVTASNPDGSVSIPSAPSAAVQSAPPFTTAAPQITGTTARAQTLSISSPGNWYGFGNTYSYQWQRGRSGVWSSIAGATDASYLLTTADEGAQIRVVVTATNPDGSQSATSAASAAVQSAPPRVLSYPQLSGSAQRGATLSATQGTWTGAGNTYAYQWQRLVNGSFNDISGSTSATYTVTASDENTLLRAVVSATNPDGTVSAPSTISPVVQGTPPVLTSVPTISGAARVGATMTATSGNWSPGDATFAYQWQRSSDGAHWSSIQGASAATYAVSQADYASTLRVLVTASNIDGAQSAASASSASITQPPVNLTPPAAPSGTLLDGSVLHADPGSWDTTASYSYSWQRCAADANAVSSDCAAIGQGSNYTLTVADIGHPIGVIVTASSSGGTSSPVASALTDLVAGRPLTNLTPPSIAGSPQVPRTLTASAGSWSVAPSADTFSWLRCDADGSSNCNQVGTGQSYTLSGDDRAHTIVLAESVASPGRTASAQSAPLAVVDQPLPQATVAPTINGTAQRTATLTATPGTWSNTPTISYQWLRCNADGSGCQPVDGATGLSYLLGQSDEGHAFTIQVSATNTSGTTTAQATLTSVVAAVPPVATHLPHITGAPAQQGVTLGVGGDAWQATSDTTYADQWERCDASGQGCVAIPGATNGLYTPSAADVSHTVVATVTATNSDGPVTAASAPSAVILPAAPRWRTLPLISDDPGTIGDTLTITPGSFTGPAVASDVTQMMRCTNACTPVGAAGVASYQIADGDLGAILRVRETASNAGGSTVLWSARYVGPVISADAGSTVIAAGRKTLRNADGVMLATAQLVSGTGARAFATNTAGRVLTLRRAHGVAGKLRAWACQAGATTTGAPGACTSQVTVRTAATLRIPLSLKGKLRIVIVRRGH